VKTKTEQLRAELKKARDIAAKAEDAGRQLTTAEKRSIDRHLKTAQEIKTAVAGDSLADGLNALESFIEGIEGGERKSRIGEPSRRGIASRTAAVPGPWSAEVPDLQAKSLVPVGTISVPFLVDDEVAAIGGPRSLIGSVIPFDELDGTDAFSYLRQTLRDNQAAPVAPGALKPTSEINLEKIEDRAKTIATLSEPIPEQWVRDVANLERFLDAELASMVIEEINDQLINGDGAGENLPGLLNVSGVQVQDFDTDLFTTMRKARTKVGTLYDGLVPDFVLLSPADNERLDLTKDLEGRYYLNRGPVGAGPDDPVWRTEVFETSAITEGVGLIGNFRSATRAIVRDEVEVQWTTGAVRDLGGGDFHSGFETNERVYRAESRVGLQISRPAALVQFETTASGSSGA